MYYYNNFIGHCGVFCGLKWRIQRAKTYFSPLLWANKKEENNVASQSELEAIQLFAPFLVCLTGSTAICKEIVLSYKIDGKPNEEANSQSSELDEEDFNTETRGRWWK